MVAEGPHGRTSRGEVNIMYTNVDGLVSSIIEVKDYLRIHNPDVICFTETKLKEEIKLGFANEGYNTWRRDRKGKGGGGVMILVKEDIFVEEVEYGDGMAETLSIVIKIEGNARRKIIVTYIPPRTNAWEINEYKNMQQEVRTSLGKMVSKNNRVLLVGDFNSKEINWEDMEVEESAGVWSEELLQTMMVNTMKQWVNKATRYRGEGEPSQLDLVFTKITDNRPEIEYQTPFGKSDHVVMEIKIQEGKVLQKSEAYREGRRNYARAGFAELRDYYGKVNWSELFEGKNVQEKYEIFLDKYEEGVKRFVPNQKVKRGKHEWYNKKCTEAKKKKDRAGKKMMRQRDGNTREEYKMARNEYSKIRKEEERKFECDIVKKCKDEPRLFYRYVNGKLKHREGVNKLKKEGRTYESDTEMSEIMNESFQSVFTKEINYIAPRGIVKKEGIQEIQVTRQEIRKLLEKLDGRKAMGPDGVNGRLLKECGEQMEEPLWDIINSSLREGKVPKEWKRANIVPIYKSGNKVEPLNYRPVSLTSIVGKLCEIIIKERWVNYLVKEKIITKKQFGLKKGRSCVTNLLSFYTRVIDGVQERDGWVDAIYLDLKKAFDKVPHKSLIWKLENEGGLGGTIMAWMKDYLQGREMRTVIRDTHSSWRQVTSGVPQGSVLAPIMFQIYVNDMAKEINSYINLFADDAKIMKVIKDENDCKELQDDIDKIYAWSQRWKLEFNARKCHAMEIGKSKKRPSWNYKMGGETVTKSKEEKDLGVIIQDTLSPERHINNIFGSTYNLLSNIRVAFNYLDKDNIMMKKIITGMVRPKMEYAAVVWAPHKKKDIKKLERIQRVATKMVTELKDLSYEERLEEMGLPTLQERRERGDLITMFKLVNNMEKVDRDDLVPQMEEGERRTRGHGKKIKKGRCLSDIKKYSFPYRTIDKWNDLKEEVVAANSVHMFKEKLDKYGYGDRTI